MQCQTSSTYTLTDTQTHRTSNGGHEAYLPEIMARPSRMQAEPFANLQQFGPSVRSAI